MSDIEKLIAKHRSRVYVEEITIKKTFYNCFGEKIDEQMANTSKFYVFDKDKCEWVQGIGENNE